MVFPAGAGVILSSSNLELASIRVSRRRGGDPWGKTGFMKKYTVFPAGAGVIPLAQVIQVVLTGVSRRRGGDPIRWLIGR